MSTFGKCLCFNLVEQILVKLLLSPLMLPCSFDTIVTIKKIRYLWNIGKVSLIVSVSVVLKIGGKLQPMGAGRHDAAQSKTTLTETSFIYWKFCGVPYSKIIAYSSVKGARSKHPYFTLLQDPLSSYLPKYWCTGYIVGPYISIVNVSLDFPKLCSTWCSSSSSKHPLPRAIN